MRIRDLLERDPSREITSVVRITEHKPSRVWPEMDEYVPTARVQSYFKDILDVLLDSQRGPTERACIWISGFFGSGKSHFLKALGYLLENRPLQDPDGHAHPSTELLARKLGLTTYLPILNTENRVLYVNLLDHDPQAPQRPTISRLVYRTLLEQQGLSTDFWVAAWERELQQLDKWEDFQTWVQQTYGRPWRDERRLNAEVVLQRALVQLLSGRYRSEEEALQALRASRARSETVTPSAVIQALHQMAVSLDPHKGRAVVLLDEAGLYIGDSVERLTDLNELAEQVVQHGEGKVLLIVTAQEALTDLVPRLTADRQILGWLRDRFRLRLGLEPTDVKVVVAKRLLAKTKPAVATLQGLYQSHQGSLRANLSIERSWNEGDFVDHYPFPPYAITLMQDIMGAMRGSVEEARRLSGAERSMLKLTHVILTGEGGITPGAEQEIGWLVSLDLFYDALAPDLDVIRAEQVRAIHELEAKGEVAGLSVARVAKALFLLQHVRQRYPCTLDNIASALVDRVEQDMHSLREAAQDCLQTLKEGGWVLEEEGQYRLLTPGEHYLESEIQQNYPRPAELSSGAIDLLRDMLGRFNYEHGQIRRPLKVATWIDGQGVQQEGELVVELFTPFADATRDEVLGRSIAETRPVFWGAERSADLESALKRYLAVKRTLEQWRTRALTPEQQAYRGRLERELQVTEQTKLPSLMQQAFLAGWLFNAGRESRPTDADIAAVLRSHLRNIAVQVYTEFVDDRPERDADCAAILTWQPGMPLPAVYGRLGLLTSNNRINHDAALLATVKAELRRREQMGHGRTGKDFVEHFEKAPYGYDPRLVRLLAATLYKAGIVGVRYENRDLTDPTEAQAQAVFSGDREFRRAIFSLLPEVDWRRASDLCSPIFAVQGGDTFERTASIVAEQASRWSQQAQTLALRCSDNGLPPEFAATCRQVSEGLQEIARQGEPNARLRRLLEKADMLSQKMLTVHRLQTFPFEGYRQVRAFVQAAADWGPTLEGEAAQRWQRLGADLDALDLPDRWPQMNEDYGFLLSRYREDYASAHQAYQTALAGALQSLREHEAFQHQPEAAGRVIQPLDTRRCDATDFPMKEGAYRCPTCHRPFAALSPGAVLEARGEAERQLDALLPPPPADKPLAPLSLARVIAGDSEVDALANELRRYARKAQRPLWVQVHAEVKE